MREKFKNIENDRDYELKAVSRANADILWLGQLIKDLIDMLLLLNTDLMYS